MLVKVGYQKLDEYKTYLKEVDDKFIAVYSKQYSTLFTKEWHEMCYNLFITTSEDFLWYDNITIHFTIIDKSIDVDYSCASITFPYEGEISTQLHM